MSDEAQWKAIEQLREGQNLLVRDMAVIQHEQEMQRKMINEQHARLAADLADIRADLRLVATDLHEARGGLAVGKWVSGIAATIAGAAVALWVWVKSGGAS
jgi:glutathione S-transferase